MKISTKALHYASLRDFPPPPNGKTGWPWTEQCPILPRKMPDGSTWPRVSIVTPSFNQGQFLEEAIRSVLLQGYPDLEYIIIDGGSTDDSINIIKKYEPWLTYWESKPDRGQSHAINKGLKRSTGLLFNWHNSDDILTPNNLSTMASAMVRYPQAGYAHGQLIIIDENGPAIKDTMRCDSGEETFSPELASAVCNLKAGYQPGCLMDRELAVKVGMVGENLHYIMDVDLLLRIALVRPPLYVNASATYLRVYASNKSSQWNVQRARERINIAQNIFKSKNLPSPIRMMKRQTFVAAHQFAWLGCAKAGACRLFFWHLFLDLLYSSGRGWKKRINLLYHLYSSQGYRAIRHNFKE